MSRTNNLIVLNGERYRCQANGSWVKYEPVKHDLYGRPVSGLVKQRGSYRTDAYFTVRVPVGESFEDRVYRLRGAATLKFQDLCKQYDLVFHVDTEFPAVIFVRRDDEKAVGQVNLHRMVLKDSA